MEDIKVTKEYSLRDCIINVFGIYMSGGNPYEAMKQAEALFGEEACAAMWDEITGRSERG